MPSIPRSAAVRRQPADGHSWPDTREAHRGSKRHAASDGRRNRSSSNAPELQLLNSGYNALQQHLEGRAGPQKRADGTTGTVDLDVANSLWGQDRLESLGELARGGEEVVVTDRGTPVARLIGIDTAPLLDRLVQRGVLSRRGRTDRPTTRSAARAHAEGSVSELVSEHIIDHYHLAWRAAAAHALRTRSVGCRRSRRL